ncbi:hypothetical protein RFI_26187 [Reticulomyxa filosa]|uniref:Uncharacterized protein n=1 Tax=Reticulomyxa filosa TaxID=46433 RepID=X6MBE6_RETFI|nr:hypothetical protein RFI_26187 [Reticulomyxa filosa]|eukprot:ETO11189.1 hypothetical protein RFI_26187 [Reticulomyxa filosa]
MNGLSLCVTFIKIIIIDLLYYGDNDNDLCSDYDSDSDDHDEKLKKIGMWMMKMRMEIMKIKNCESWGNERKERKKINKKKKINFLWDEEVPSKIC